MRVQPLLLPILALSFGFTLAACAGADDLPRVTSHLECETGGGQTSLCTLTLAAPAGFKVTLTGRNLTDEIVMNRGGIVPGATTGRIGLPRNYSAQIERQW